MASYKRDWDYIVESSSFSDAFGAGAELGRMHKGLPVRMSRDYFLKLNRS